MPELPMAVRTLLAAANGGDTEAFLDGFVLDGVVDDWGRQFTGHGAIRRWSDDEFIGKRVSLKVNTVLERDGDWTVEATVGGDGFNGPSHFTFELDGSLVSRMTIRA